jgi:hypothetical protein
MALVVKDRVRETSTTTGTGAVTLNGAVSNFQSFSVIGDANTTFYTITLDSAGEWEVGIGTYTLSTTSLSRDIVLESSNSGALVPFSAGTKTVFCTYPAEKSVYLDAVDDVEIGTQSLGTGTDTRKLTIASNGYAVVNINGDYSNTAGEPGGSAVVLDVDGSGSPNAVVSYVNTAGTRGDSSTAYTGTVSNSMLLGTIGATSLQLGTDSNVYATLSPAGNMGFKTVNDDTAIVQIGAGTTTTAPLEFIQGTLMTVPDAGTMEYDGVTLAFTPDVVGSRGYVPAVNLFRLAANGTAIGPAISNFFGANSAASIGAGADYLLEAFCFFTKTTAGTVTVTLTCSQTPIAIAGTLDYGAVAGGNATGAANRISQFNTTTGAFGASGSLTTAVNHAFVVRAIIETHATNNGNIRINFTSSAGTVTPLRNSYYKITRIPTGNYGNFVA